MKKVIITLAAAAFATASFAQTTFYDAFTSYSNAVSASESLYTFQYSASTPGYLANEETLTQLGTITNFNVWAGYYDGTSTDTATYSTSFTFDIWANSSANKPGTLLDSISYSTSMENGYVYGLELTLGTPINLAAQTTSNSVWFGYYSNTPGDTIGYGYAPVTGTSTGALYYGTNGTSWTNYATSNSPTGNWDFAAEFQGTPAPEPVSMTFLGLGVVGLIAKKRKASK